MYKIMYKFVYKFDNFIKKYLYIILYEILIVIFCDDLYVNFIWMYWIDYSIFTFKCLFSSILSFSFSHIEYENISISIFKWMCNTHIRYIYIFFSL